LLSFHDIITKMKTPGKIKEVEFLPVGGWGRRETPVL
jgi:hypothetical protein